MHGRDVDGTRYSFGHEGTLYRQSFIMYDKQTGSLWVHATGEAVKGPAKGKVLPFLASTVCSWKTWKRLHPKTTVLTGRPARGHMGRFNLRQGPERYGLSVGQGVGPKLYPFPILMKRRVLNDAHAAQRYVVVYDAETRTARAFDWGGHTFRWRQGSGSAVGSVVGSMIDESGRPWDPLRGVCLAKGQGKSPARLTPLPATIWLSDRWHGFHPHGAVYRASK